MGSKKAELYQISVGQKRKILDARAFKALFKRQRTKEDLPGIITISSTQRDYFQLYSCFFVSL